MKIVSAFLLFCITTLFVYAQPDYNYQKRFQVKSGHVEYRLSGNISGTKSLWWDDYGEKYSEEINTRETFKTGNRTETVKNHSLTVCDGAYYYNVNLETMEGTKLHKDAVPDFSILGSGLSDSEMEQLGESLLGVFGGKVEKESQTVLGRLCDVSDIMGVSVYSYKGVTLKSYAKVKSDADLEEAVSFDENISIPASRFTPPENAALEDVSVDMTEDEYYGEEPYGEEEGFVYSSGIDFDTFRNESERVRRVLGYGFAIHDASGGEYSAMWSKDDANTAWILVNSLQDYANWREDFADEGIEYFSESGNRMAFRHDNMYDEESGRSTAVSIMLVELTGKDAFIRVIMPQKTKEELLDIFNHFKF